MSEALSALWTAKCLPKRPQQEMLDMVAYKLRVMLSHIRIKYDSASRDDALADVFAIMDGKEHEHHPRKWRRMERLKSRPCPFGELSFARRARCS